MGALSGHTLGGFQMKKSQTSAKKWSLSHDMRQPQVNFAPKN